MFKNYLLVAIRHFWHNKIFSFINIIGLSIGISASLVIFLIVHYDLTFDKFHKDSDRIYRIVTDFNENGAVAGHMRALPEPLTDAVANDMTGIEYTVPLYILDHQRVSIPTTGAKPIVFRQQPNIIYAGSAYFSVFQYQWLAGSPATALQEPFRVVLTAGRVRTYFPGLSPEAVIGRTITYFDSIPVTVSGVVEELKGNTDFVFAEFISFRTMTSNSLRDSYDLGWNSISSSMQLFIKLAKGRKISSIAGQLKQIQDKYDPQGQTNTKDPKTFRAFVVQPLSDLHLGEYGSFDNVRQASRMTLYGTSLLAVILLFLACINFINLMTARASQRAREVGIRKTIGSSRRQLIFQFLGETFLTTFIATILSALLAPLLLRVFSEFIPPEIQFNWVQQPALIVFFMVLLPGVTIVAGFYPAIILSRYMPFTALRGAQLAGSLSGRPSLLRKILTVSQFVIAQGFIIATLMIGRQIHFMLTTDLGFRQKAIVYFYTPPSDTSTTHRLALLNELRTLPGVAATSLGGNPPSSASFWGRSLTYTGGSKPIHTPVELKIGDTNFLSLYHIPLLAGRNVHPSDTIREYVINETYARQLGFKDPHQAINQYLSDGSDNSIHFPIVGVIRDFYAHSLQQPIQPLVFTANNQRSTVIHIALPITGNGGASWASTLQAIGDAYKKFYPDAEFSYRFYDESIAKFYKSEKDLASLLRWATGIAILISCLGMLGLVVHTTTLRTKEIGIRKVMGATVAQIVRLLSLDFIVLVGIAFVIAAPGVWWGMHKWLQDYAYRPAFGWWLFLLAGAGMAVIAMLTLGLQTVRAARANPVDSLRTE
jgi:ABC-type antimicrobial peptide transport system permease subunit